MITKFSNLDEFFAFIDAKREEIVREFAEKTNYSQNLMTTAENPEKKSSQTELILNHEEDNTDQSLMTGLKTQNLIQLAWSTSLETPQKGETTDTTMIMEQLTLRESELDAIDDIIGNEIEKETEFIDSLGLDALPFPLSQFPLEDREMEKYSDDIDSLLDLDLDLEDDLDLDLDLLVTDDGVTGESAADSDHDYDFDISISQIPSTQAAFPKTHEEPATAGAFVGFKTGRGCALPAPSKEALKRARSLIEQDEESEIENERDNNINSCINDNFSIGFTTGNGKALKPPSEEAIKRAKSLIEPDAPENETLPIESIQNDPSGAAFPSFSTAKGKALPPPSKEALQRAQSLIEEFDNGCFGYLGSEKKLKEPSNVFPSFSTAKGKALPLPSKDALEKANNLIENVKIEAQESFGNVGFSTGRGKVMARPSEEALKRAAQLITFDENEKENVKITSDHHRADKVQKLAPVKKSLVPGNTAFKPPSRLGHPTEAAGSSIPGKPFSLSTAWKNPRPRPKPMIKKLFDLSTSGEKRFKLKEFFKKTPKVKSSLDDYVSYGIDEQVLRMTSGNAIRFEFANGWGHAAAHQCLLSLGAQSSTISPEWTANHYRWIVWKFCAMIRAFPDEYSPANLSPEWILQQLCYRYEREVNLCQRSPLKKIIERDDAASRYLCLMVAEIDFEKRALELSDGWYSIWTNKLDDSMWNLMERRRIVSGTKIEIFGASLVGGQDAIPALEASSPECTNCRLQFGRNSCRPAKWDTKLGFIFGPERPVAFLKHLHQIHAQGGLVPAIRVRIDRIYPLLIREERAGENSTVLRSEREHFIYLENRGERGEGFEESKFSPIQKIRVSTDKPEYCALITFWKALGEDQKALLQEGTTVIFTNLRAGKSNSFINADLALSSTKSTAIYESTVQMAPKACEALRIGRFGGFRELRANELHDVIGISLGRVGNFYWIGFPDDPLRGEEDETKSGDDFFDSSLICIRNFNCILVPGEKVTFKDLLFTHYDGREGVAHFSFTDYSDFVKEKKNPNECITCNRAQDRFRSLLGQ